MLRAFAAERKFLIITTRAKKPDIQSTVYMEILKDLQSTMGAVNDIREANRASTQFNHLTTVSEGIAVLGWITIEPKPGDYISEMLSSAQFYGNRVINLHKEKFVLLQDLHYLISLAVLNHVQGQKASGMGQLILRDL